MGLSPSPGRRSGLVVDPRQPTIRVWEDNPSVAVSIHTVVETYLGKLAGVAGVTFWILINCTLVSQRQMRPARGARHGRRGQRRRVGWATRLGTLSAVIIMGAAFRRDVGRINALATTGLFCSFAAACLAGAAGISADALAKANLLLAMRAPAIMQAIIPAIPTVVDVSGSRKKIGACSPSEASVTLMYMLWLAVTLGRRDLAAFGASGGGWRRRSSPPVTSRPATTSIAVCASIGTLIGCYLALSRFNADTFHLPLNKGCKKLLALTVLPSLVWR